MKPCCLLLAAALGASSPAVAQWIDLFDGESLAGWRQLGGEASYAAEEGAIVGRTAPNTPNSFLCTERHFGDFVLEYEFLVDPRLNSGVQVRSHSLAEHQDGRVHGYQIEIDPSPRAWTAGLYEEGRRGWLQNLADKPDAQAAFKQGEWNRVRVEAVGQHFRTWLNGVPAVDHMDGMTASGFIGLQVHSVKTNDTLEVRWRNLRLREVPFEMDVTITNGGAEALAPAPLAAIIPGEHGPQSGALALGSGDAAVPVAFAAVDEGLLVQFTPAAPLGPGESVTLPLRAVEGERAAVADPAALPYGVTITFTRTALPDDN